MRIAIWYHLPSGGGKRALYHHVKGLVQRGHHVEAWCPSTANRQYLPLGEIIAEHPVAYTREPYRPRGVWDRFTTYKSWRKRFAAIDEHCQFSAREINEGDFDVLLAGNCIDVAVSPVARHVRIPSLLYHQEPNRSFYEARPSLPWLAAPVQEARPSWLRRAKTFIRDQDFIRSIREEAREERSSAEAFTLMLVNSSFSRESILRAYGIDSKVCYLGIDTGLFQNKGLDRGNYVVGLGGIHPHKGVGTAIHALATLPPVRRPELIWIGNVADAGYEKEMLRLAAEHGVRLEVRHLVSDSELADTLGRAAMMVYTSSLEPFGFAPLEANACGTPVVAVAEGGVRETVVDGVNGLLVADRDPEVLGSAILRLLDDPELGSRLGKAGSENVRKKWTWEKSVERLEHHLFSICTSDKRATPAGG